MYKSLISIDCQMIGTGKLLKLAAVVVLLTVNLPSKAQDDLSDAWSGEWVANGTYFRIAVSVNENVLSVTQLESLGFEWTSKDAVIDGNIVEVEVDYETGGVSGIIRAELLSQTTGVLSVKTCAPDFMVSCALSKGRKAYFTKVAD